MNLVETVMMLSYGLPMISDDDRIKGVVDVLEQIFKVSYDTIALYTGLTIEDIENFMENNLTSYEKKYKLATTTMMLHYLFKQPKKIINKNEL